MLEFWKQAAFHGLIKFSTFESMKRRLSTSVPYQLLIDYVETLKKVSKVRVK
jgi:hypothetical protein